MKGAGTLALLLLSLLRARAPGCRVVLAIMGEVAPLAHRLEHLIPAILRRVIEVRGGEHHLALCHRMRLAMEGLAPPSMIVAALALALAPAARPLKADALGDGS